MRRQIKTGMYEIYQVREFSSERQIEMELDLEEGEYVIVPRTTGCNLRKSPGMKVEKIS